MLNRLLRVAAIGIVVAALPSVAAAQAITGIALYEQYCGTCHASPAAGSRAPDRVALAQLSPEAILEAITTGPMTVNAEGLSPAQKRSLAELLAARPLGSMTSGSIATMSNHCTPRALTDPMRGPRWSGWGVDTGNSRFQSGAAAGLTTVDVPKLKLKW